VSLLPYAFQDMVEVQGGSASKAKPYYKYLGKEDFLWFLGEVVEAARLSGFFEGEELLNIIGTRIRDIDALYDANEGGYWDQVEGAGRRELAKLFMRLCRNQRTALLQLGSIYAYEVADRILHDRELCCFITETVMDIGFSGETVEGMRSQWVERERWPARVKNILWSRDRGKCAAFGEDILLELRAEAQVDHMFALANATFTNASACLWRPAAPAPPSMRDRWSPKQSRSYSRWAAIRSSSAWSRVLRDRATTLRADLLGFWHSWCVQSASGCVRAVWIN
jgi:hypothetical protein